MSVMDDYEALWTDYPNYRIRHYGDNVWSRMRKIREEVYV